MRSPGLRPVVATAFWRTESDMQVPCSRFNAFGVSRGVFLCPIFQRVFKRVGVGVF